MFLTDHFQLYFNLGLTFIFIILFDIFYVFRNETIFAIFFYNLIVIFVYFLLIGYYSWEKKQVRNGWVSQDPKRDVTLGLAGITVAGFVARILNFVICGQSIMDQFYYYFLINILCSVFYTPVFLAPNALRSPNPQPNQRKQTKTMTAAFLVLTLFPTLILALINQNYHDHFLGIVIVQTFYSLFTASSIDLAFIVLVRDEEPMGNHVEAGETIEEI